MQKTTPIQARKRWFTGHRLQKRYLSIVVFAMAAPALVVGFCLYHLVFFLVARQMAFPEAVLANLVPVISRVNTILFVALPPLALLIFGMAVVISHRFSGPIERIERELDAIAEGNTEHRLRLREEDDWNGVARRLNRILDERKKL